MRIKKTSFRTKIINGDDLTSECWFVQAWGLSYCLGFGNYKKVCKYLGTEECGGQRIRKKIFEGEYPLSGLQNEAD